MNDIIGSVAPRGKTVLQPFDYDGVRLLPGRMLAQVNDARAMYGAIPNDDLLKGFRRAAGLPAPCTDMRGWCANTTGGIFGQLLSGMARMGRATGDGALIEKAALLLDGWEKTLPEDGDSCMRPYEFEKMVCGLVDLHEYAGVANAMPLLERTTERAAAQFDRSRSLAGNFDFQGTGPGRTTEWYTLPENLYRAYLLSGRDLFREFADVWLYHDYWAPFAATAEPNEVVPVHAYSHVNSFSSAAMAYAVTGEARYLRICRNAFDFLQRTQCYATGGFGPDERLMPPDGSLGRSLDLYAGHAEIPCGTWAATKFSRYLIGFTGEARFGDWIETMLYNAIGAALPTEPDGRTYYYGDYRISSGLKQFYWYEWPCCAGTYWQTVADYHNIIYFRDAAGLSVNLFVPSEVQWHQDGQLVMLRQQTDYPEAETTSLRLTMDRPAAFALRFRVPGWCSGMTIAVNGSPAAVAATPGTWACLERTWQTGDEVTLRLPMALRMLPVDRQHPDRVAILYGPVVLAQDEACCRRPFALEPGARLESRLVCDAVPLRFNIVDTAPERHRRYLEPLYRFTEFWPYWVYFDLTAPPLY
jgi:hypothetical protein